MEVLVHRSCRIASGLSIAGSHLCRIQEAQILDGETSQMTDRVAMEKHVGQSIKLDLKYPMV